MNKAHINFEDILNRIQAEPGVSNIIMTKNDTKNEEPNAIVYSTINNLDTVDKLAKLTDKMYTDTSNVVRNVDPANDLLVLRIGTKHHEIIVTHEQEFLVIVLQVVQNVTSLQPESSIEVNRTKYVKRIVEK